VTGRIYLIPRESYSKYLSVQSLFFPLSVERDLDFGEHSFFLFNKYYGRVNNPKNTYGGCQGFIYATQKGKKNCM
jgi:hypothetical protein